MSLFKHMSNRLAVYIFFVLLLSPFIAFGSMFATFLFCALFGELIALTYLNIIFFSLFVTYFLFLGYMFCAKIVPKEDLKKYYAISFFLPFTIVLVVFTSISLVFGIIL